MRILLTSQAFPPEIHPTAVMVSHLADYLSARGHKVRVACGYPHHPVGRVLGGYVRRPILRERRGDVGVVRAWHFVSSDPRVWVRALVMASQSLAIAAAGVWSGRAEVVVNYGPPLAGPLLSWLVALRSGAPLVSVVYDIYPDAAIRTMHLQNPVLIWLARLAERVCYRVSSRVLVLSDGFRRQLLSKGVPGSKRAMRIQGLSLVVIPATSRSAGS
jgi:colanic acid biosynthesis glycosyl transferase WcaI